MEEIEVHQAFHSTDDVVEQPRDSSEIFNRIMAVDQEIQEQMLSQMHATDIEDAYLYGTLESSESIYNDDSSEISEDTE